MHKAAMTLQTTTNPGHEISLNDESRAELVTRKAACPFIGSAIAQGLLPVRNAADNPLASVDDVAQLGNSGTGSTLGSVLWFFASGNHAVMRGTANTLDHPAPDGLFSLEFPGSQGSHPGHSGMLQGDPLALDSGRFSQSDFVRLEGLAVHGVLTRNSVARFIAGNLRRDPQSKVLSLRMWWLLLRDLLALTWAVLAFLIRFATFSKSKPAAFRNVLVKFCRTLGENNLAGSAGEFGLLFALLAHKPDAPRLDGRAAVAMADVRLMFRDKRLPDGWQYWKKSGLDWAGNTALLAILTGYHYLGGKLRLLKTDPVY